MITTKTISTMMIMMITMTMRDHDDDDDDDGDDGVDDARSSRSRRQRKANIKNTARHRSRSENTMFKKEKKLTKSTQGVQRPNLNRRHHHLRKHEIASETKTQKANSTSGHLELHRPRPQQDQNKRSNITTRSITLRKMLKIILNGTAATARFCKNS